jgi:ribonucleoside-diphosphate reductase beta chain
MLSKPSIPKTKTVSHYINKISKLIEDQEVKDEKIKRYSLFPILDEESYTFYQKQENIHWSETEMDFIADKPHYDNAPKRYKRIMDIILAFFLPGDGAISKNIIFRFLLECESYEDMAMFISQLHIELIHAATYGLAAFTFKQDEKAMAELIEMVENVECIKRKIAFMEKWMLSDAPRYQRLVAFCCAEGIFFCTLFAIIFKFRAFGWFPNFIFANELISRDESLHRDYGAHLFRREIAKILSQYEKDSKEYKEKYEEIKKFTHEIVSEALDVEYGFVEFILLEDDVDDTKDDLTVDDLKTYAQLMGDNLLVQLSYSSVYKVKNPFTWLNDISLEQKGNFYEVRIGAYNKKSLSDVLDWRKRAGITKTTHNVYEEPESVDF